MPLKIAVIIKQTLPLWRLALTRFKAVFPADMSGYGLVNRPMIRAAQPVRALLTIIMARPLPLAGNEKRIDRERDFRYYNCKPYKNI